MERTFVAYIGIDWSDRKHDICLHDPKSEQRETAALKNFYPQVLDWFIGQKSSQGDSRSGV